MFHVTYVQVLALVGFRKMMDYIPSVFSQNDLYWLDNLMPTRKKNDKNKKTVKESPENGCKEVTYQNLK